MYQPSLRPDQVRALYRLKLERRQPMTHLAREAVDRYLSDCQAPGKWERAPDERWPEATSER